MSDALSDIARDEQIARNKDKCYELEKIFFSDERPLNEETVESATQIVMAWGQYARGRGGYWSAPSESTATKRVRLFGEFIEGKMSYNDLKKQIERANLAHGYFAVGRGCHQKLMQVDDHQLLSDLLKEKLGERPDSFFVSKGRDGKLIIEKATCATCPLVGRCAMKDRCNGYDEKEYSAAVKRLGDNGKLANKYCQEFGLTHLVRKY